ncbi:hypothetical protein TRFO_07050 [Tritrichomonas foetus]|uniref:Uncharacterized protein n=1 Tax=Tritrichomonas foetus TaxID=1144522 RepID=A0A1J4JUF0_9EUKA|nr:hypothetical protein TRFO_07050 [Tritrichomonas foetus]|eukprot:OHT02627.1 hypothetical protein TRFO_07050 [Tritrichomonas foetus]
MKISIRLLMDENLQIVNCPYPPSKKPFAAAPRHQNTNYATFCPPTPEELNRVEFHNPIYLNELGNHLIDDITALKTEIQPLRDQLRFLLQLDSNFTESFRVNPVKKQNKNKKRFRADLSSQIAELNAVQDELDIILRDVKYTYSDYFYDNLVIDISEESKQMVKDGEEIERNKRDFKKSKKKLKTILNSQIKLDIEQNEKRVVELQELLLELKKEESESMEKHQILLNNKPSFILTKADLKPLIKRLETIKYTHSKKVQEVVELRAKYDAQKDQVRFIINQRAKEALEHKKRIDEYKAFKAKVKAEKERKLQEYAEREAQLRSKIKITKKKKKPTKTFKLPYVKPAAITESSEEMPKKRYHHHRRPHRKHHHYDSHVFTTSDPRLAEIETTQPIGSDCYHDETFVSSVSTDSNTNKKNYLSTDEFHSISSSKNSEDGGNHSNITIKNQNETINGDVFLHENSEPIRFESSNTPGSSDGNEINIDLGISSDSKNLVSDNNKNSVFVSSESTKLSSNENKEVILSSVSLDSSHKESSNNGEKESDENNLNDAIENNENVCNEINDNINEKESNDIDSNDENTNIESNGNSHNPKSILNVNIDSSGSKDADNIIVIGSDSNETFNFKSSGEIQKSDDYDLNKIPSSVAFIKEKNDETLIFIADDEDTSEELEL